MTPEDLKRLEAIQSTVLTDGWKYLVEEIETKVDVLKQAFTSPEVGLELLRLGQGRIMVYNELLSLRTIIDNQLDNIKQDAEDDKNEAVNF